jgi:predicted branched-subunit amino acid permease
MTTSAGKVSNVALSVGLATGVYGISFGALSVTAGFDIWQTIALSVLMFSGGSQFAFVAVGLADLTTAATSAWLVGVRNGFYALSLAPILETNGVRKILAAQLTIDESAAVSTSRETLAEQRKGFWLTGISVFVFWNLATVMGAFLGQQIGDPETFGLDAAAAAALFALVWPRIQKSAGAIIAGTAIVTSVLFSLVLPSGPPVLIGAFIAVVVGFLLNRGKGE